MHLFVTGGAGYIGSVSTEYLLDEGHQVTVFDNLSEGHAAAVDPRARLIRGDLRSLEEITRAMEESHPEAVLHFAASALVGESVAHPGKYFRNNVSAGINLLDAMTSVGVKQLVFSSSCATYGLPVKLPIKENAPQAPINPYGESKLLFERMLPWYQRAHGLRYVGLRFFNVAGASWRRGEDHRIETHLVPNVLRVALGQRDSVQICGGDYPTADGTPVRDFLHVVDVARAHLAALNANESGIYNLGLGRGYSVGEVIACAREITGHAIPIQTIERRVGDPPELIADASRAFRELGWKPLYTELADIVQSAWTWHRHRPSGYALAGAS